MAEVDLLRPIIIELLRTVPETWTEFDSNETSVKERAASLLVAAGMIERRGRYRASFTNHPVCFEIRWEATGEAGYSEIVERVSAEEYATWGDAWRAWKAGETGHVSPFHTEHLKPQEWRLTDQGVLARKELESDVNNVLDFVLKRGPYGPGYWVLKYRENPAFVEESRELLARYTAAGFDWRLLPRLPLRGFGRLLDLRRVENPTGPQAVKLTNWAEGGDAFAAAFAKNLGPMFEALSKSQQASTSPPPTRPPVGPDQGEDGRQGKADHRGVSLLDAALLLNDGDYSLARQTVDRWQKQRSVEKPSSIGNCPNHKQVKLFAPLAICDFIEKIGDIDAVAKKRLLTGLVTNRRAPR